MSNNLNSLLQRVAKSDKALAAELRMEMDHLVKRREFGLNFEKHRPETVELHGRRVRVGDKVRFLPSRGSSGPVRKDVWLVQSINGDAQDPSASLLIEGGEETQTRALDDVVVVADFRDPIYPGLASRGTVGSGGEKPSHVVIKSENYHALEALLFTTRGQVDVIYIDPPYNTGAKDWKYNNDYVDSEDSFRHSKWLSFMERRLKLAKKLLNPRDSVLIVTIDEKEYLRLGLLLEQTFKEARIQMVSSVINPKGATRPTAFGRTDEYVYFVMLGSAGPRPQALGNEWKVVRDLRSERLRWAELLRAGTNARREDRRGLFYPVFLRGTDEGPVFDSVGETYLGEERSEIVAPEGCVTVWPLRSDGSEGNWQVNPAALRLLIARGYARVGGWREERSSITYLKRGEQRKVDEGIFPVLGHRPDGSVIVDANDYTPVFVPGTQWRIPSHEAGGPGGTGLLRLMLPGRRFPFPKSLYAVEDALRFFVADKPDALILDFFGGSGTTTHAVARLNRQDGGRRRSVLVTNNEVSAAEQAQLRRDGLRPGDAGWEAQGICEHITEPRIRAAISGDSSTGEPVKGDYKFIDEFPMSEGFDETVEFFDLTYQDPLLVELDLAFAAISPLLWIRAGSRGRRIDTPNDTFAVADTYGVLFSIDASRAFVSACRKADAVRTAYIVTDDEKQFQMVASALPRGVQPVRLYESYLRTFEINTGKE